MSKIGIIGGITAYIEGHPYGQIKNGDSNDGTIAMSFRGTGRNITENLARIGEDVIFVSATGDDFAGKGAVRELSELGVNVDNVSFLKGENTAVNMSILNIVDDLELALNNTDVLEKLSKDMIDTAAHSLKECAIVGLDTTGTEEMLEYITQKLDGVPIFLDPVSEEHAKKVKSLLEHIHTIKPNRLEAEAITGLNILNEEELYAAGEWFITHGVKRVFMTLSGGGVFYTDGQEKGIIRPEKMIMKKSTDGAGDAFSAAILSGFVNGYDMKKTAELGMAAAAISIESDSAVNSTISRQVLEAKCEEMYLHTKK